MSELPSGTVSLLFSDIEGSTALLSRLGPAYADALDGQRQVLRKAWAEHGGTELGTEGDSFFVVFNTAEDAVKAATQAQRELAAFEWPSGEQVRVRMGIHTGTPQIHDGGYVGMDVHRAARIAAAAHGGQVVISEVTAKLASRCLPEGVGLRELGSHRLKDISQPERLFQLVIEGLRIDFPALKTLGAASTLPQPATPLVGRDGELAELTALLSSEVRLVTLTGPGGSGKTRLAIGVAQRLIERFPDGVYFVPLAAASTVDMMWTSIAEALEVPAEGRTPPALFTHVAHRSALLVLDNLEQIVGADAVVAELLAAAPKLVAIATSRTPLTVAAEHLHPVPPLELPGESTLDSVAASGAVQLFVGRARKTKPSFELTAGNAAEIAEVCRRLDGLPLAIELAAARIRLLSPAALLARLHTALELKDTAVDRPTRQRTLRDTIAWSYELLNPTQQGFFRALGVFAGGADLDAITAVTVERLDGSDPLDLVADLVGASLATITDDDRGEPRVGMLETIRTYAYDQLVASGEEHAARWAHAQHYLRSAERLNEVHDSDYLRARGLAEMELDNYRAALRWSLESPLTDALQRGVVGEETGIRLCASLGWLWRNGGYLAEGRYWCEKAIERANGRPSSGLARCLDCLAALLRVQGEVEYACAAAAQGVAIARTLADPELISAALGSLAAAQTWAGDLDGSDRSLEEALALSRAAADRSREAMILGDMGVNALFRRDYLAGERLSRESLVISQELGDTWPTAVQRSNIVYALAHAGRVEDADKEVRDSVDDVLSLRDPELTISFAGGYVRVLARKDDPISTARFLGALEAMGERSGMTSLTERDEEMSATLAAAQALIPAEVWEQHYQRGRSEPLEPLLRELTSRDDNPPPHLVGSQGSPSAR